MLSRTADHLYWMGRYIERAETTARLLEVGARNALLPDVSGGYRNDWDAVLRALGVFDNFVEKFGELNERNITTFLFFDAENPTSVLSCLNAARENARVVRTALTGHTWEAINNSFQELKEFQRTERSKLSLSDLADWTQATVSLIRGAIDGTQLRDDGYRFVQLGIAIERGDNTARFLDVKYYVLLPSLSYVGSSLDQTQWSTLLKSLSAHRAFTWAYQGEITAAKIAHFLILNGEFPRSLYSSAQCICEHLDMIARRYGKSTKAQTAARGLLAELAEASVDDIFDEGLHEFLTRYTRQNAEVAHVIQTTYLAGVLV